jgi:hypothetical protein
VFLVTTGDAPPVEKWRLPKDLERLRSIQSVTVRDAAWGSALQQLIDALVPPLRPSAGAGKSTKPGASNGEGVHGQSLHG